MSNWHLVFIYNMYIYVLVYMQNQCLFFYQHKQWIQITAISHQNAYRGFLIKISWGSMPPDPPDCARRKLCAAHIVRRAQIVRCTETEPPSTMMLSHFSGGNPAHDMPN